jgi:methylated-DNA-[protein]-cysteine S-methyltransferase
MNARTAFPGAGPKALYTSEFDSPIGTLFAASTPAGLAYLGLPRASGRGFAGWLRRHAPDAAVRESWKVNRRAASEVLEYLEGKRTAFELELDLRATPFQARVLRAVARIPYGETRAYGDVARSIRQPEAVRAVGAANGANPIPLVIPCHRVVASTGKLHGYGGGLELKAWLLAMERSTSAPEQGRLL